MTAVREGRYQTTQARALWFCTDCGAVVPIEARDVHDRTHDGDPRRPTLADLQARYLEVRQLTLSTAGIATFDRFVAQARYVLGEAGELRYAVRDYVTALNQAQFEENPADFAVDELQHVRHEIADVVISATVLAGYLDTTVEACIAEKTEHDRGRG